MRANGREALRAEVRRRAAARVPTGRRWTVNDVLRRRAERRARRSFLVALATGGLAAAGALALGVGLI